jgi:hypothetical protein
MSDLDWDDPKKWLGRGLENVPGKPFGWAHAHETRAIEEHLIAKGYKPNSSALFYRVRKIQDRLHKNRLSLKDRQAAIIKPKMHEYFSAHELEHLADLFNGANDPVSLEIRRKALLMLEAGVRVK